MKSKINTLFETIEYRYEPVHLKLDLTDFLQNMSSVLANIQVDLHKKDKSKSSFVRNENNTQSQPDEIKFGIVFDYIIKGGKTQFYINKITDYEENIQNDNPRLNTYIFYYQSGKLIPVHDTDHNLSRFELIYNDNKPKFNQINVSYSPNSQNKEITLHFFKKSLYEYKIQPKTIDDPQYYNTRYNKLPPDDDDVIDGLNNAPSRIHTRDYGNLNSPSLELIGKLSKEQLSKTPEELTRVINEQRKTQNKITREDLE